jgi:hypothetical protein
MNTAERKDTVAEIIAGGSVFTRDGVGQMIDAIVMCWEDDLLDERRRGYADGKEDGRIDAENAVQTARVVMEGPGTDD